MFADKPTQGGMDQGNPYDKNENKPSGEVLSPQAHDQQNAPPKLKNGDGPFYWQGFIEK
jgi:hypothetical protein